MWRLIMKKKKLNKDEPIYSVVCTDKGFVFWQGDTIMHVRSQDEIDGSSVSYDTIIRTWINCGVIMA